MSYRLAGRSTDFCSCNTPCPCAFGQQPTGGTCKGLGVFTAPVEYISVRRQVEPQGRWSAVRDEPAELFRAHDRSAGAAVAYPGEHLVAVGRRAGRGG